MTNFSMRLRLTRALVVTATLWLSAGMVPAQADDQIHNPRVLMKTTDGEITIELFADKSPITVENFLNYVDAGHYDGTVFHRVIPNFMIQGGGFTAALEEKETGDPIVNESINKLHNTRGTLAMARTSDPDSATAQFFINQRSNLRLDWAGAKMVTPYLVRSLTVCKWSTSLRYLTPALHVRSPLRAPQCFRTCRSSQWSLSQ